MTASTGSHFYDVVGCYQDTGHTTNLKVWTSKIFRKKCPVRYLLQLETTGNWAIAEDILGKNIILEQDRSNYPRTPNTVAGSWIFKNKKAKYIHSFKVSPRKGECISEECSNGKVNARSIPETTTEKAGDETDSTAYYMYIVFGVIGGLTLLLCLVSVVLCIRRRKEASKRETVDENPDYGDDYYEGRSQVMDQNEYYYTDV